VRIAIFGGTFDPVHSGHLRVAEAVADAFEIDELHFVPTFTPPHKDPIGITSAFHRFAMVALAIAPFDRFRLSTIEADRLGARYTVDTLELMHDLYPEATLLFITGADLFAEIEDWKDYERLFELANIAVINRPGSTMRHDIRPVEVVTEHPENPLSSNPRVYYLPELNEDISSTRLREQLQHGHESDEWVPSAVRAYITRHKLYS
jgi:nicotinate-nucleotide adenylyltransferase